MNIPELPAKASRQELRKAMLRLRLEMHRQELRHEGLLLLQPVLKARDFTHNLREGLQGRKSPLWITGGALLLATLGVRHSNWRRWIRIAAIVVPLMTGNGKAHDTATSPPP
ncbi:MAG: hypothetical protein ABWY06_23780 [Pseudomonas sp.]|uniref:hypothetical protein n=1 Tax=Pseudomonas sp. TaxID=306 RepID=UPI00339A21DD